MYVENIRLEDSDVETLKEWVFGVFQPDYGLNLGAAEVFFSESFSVLNSNKYLTVLTLKVTENQISVSVLTGGTSHSAIGFDFGTAKRRVRTLIDLIIEYAENNEFGFEVLDQVKI